MDGEGTARVGENSAEEEKMEESRLRKRRGGANELSSYNFEVHTNERVETVAVRIHKSPGARGGSNTRGIERVSLKERDMTVLMKAAIK